MGIAYEGGVGVPTIPGQNGVQHTGAVAPLTLHVAQESEYSEPTAPIALRLQPEPAPSPEVEIGNIMIQLQRFTDETAAEAERKAQEVIAGAEAQAAVLIQRASEANGQAQAIVQSAHAEAQSIVQAAHAQAESIAQQTRANTTLMATGPAIAPETVQALCSAIEEFAATNQTLVAELAELRQALQAPAPTAFASPAPPAASPAPDLQATQQIPVISAEQFPVQAPPQTAGAQTYSWPIEPEPGHQYPVPTEVPLYPVESVASYSSEPTQPIPAPQFQVNVDQLYSA